MDEEQTQLWYKLRTKAAFLISRGHAPAQFDAFSLFQVVVLPSFEPTVCWDICMRWEDEETKSYLAVRSEWRRDFDREQFEQRKALLPIKRKYLPPLEPSIEMRTAPLPEDWCLAMLAKLQKIHVPIYNEGVWRDENGLTWGILDGTSYELAFEAGHVSARFHWAEEPPAPWQPLNAFVQEVLNTLNEL